MNIEKRLINKIAATSISKAGGVRRRKSPTAPFREREDTRKKIKKELYCVPGVSGFRSFERRERSRSGDGN